MSGSSARRRDIQFILSTLGHRAPYAGGCAGYSAAKEVPLALDICAWMTLRASCATKPSEIPVPWQALAMQFGSEYAQVRDFKAAFPDELRKVHTVYAGARFELGGTSGASAHGNVLTYVRVAAGYSARLTIVRIRSLPSPLTYVNAN